jgi:hypothetical protein
MTTRAPGRRDDALRILILSAEHRLPLPAPTSADECDVPTLNELLDAVDAPRHIFTDTDDLLSHIHHVWFACLRGRVEQVMFEDFDDLEQAVVLAWECTAQDLPAIRALLDAYAGQAALVEPTSRELAYLAHASGAVQPSAVQASAVQPSVVEAGRSIVAAARAITYGGPGSHAA